MTYVCVGQEVPGTGYEQVYFGKLVELPVMVDGQPITGQMVGWIDLGQKSIELEDCQLCVFFSPTMKSWFELATKGPSEACRVSNPVKRAVIGGVREILECTEQAAQAWRSCPWASKLPQQIMHAGPHPAMGLAS